MKMLTCALVWLNLGQNLPVQDQILTYKIAKSSADVFNAVNTLASVVSRDSIKRQDFKFPARTSLNSF